jgi:translin
MDGCASLRLTLDLAAAEKSLERIEGDLQQVLERRERILKSSRDVILASSRAIVFLHSRKKDDAHAEIQKAQKMLGKMREDGKGNLSRYLISPETEFVEASVVESVVLGKALPDMKSLGVSDEAYLLGLLDSIGELKRMLLVSITDGKVKNAAEYFELMERFYSMLSPFAVFDNIVNGVRRKIDVGRMITEDTRGIVAEETRRRTLLSAIERLQKGVKR